MELWSRGTLLSMFLGLVATSLGMLSMIFRPCEIIVMGMTKFRDGGPLVQLWSNPEIEIFLKVYIFNITNKEAFLAGTEKLKFAEVGPYIYRENMKHEQIKFNQNGTLTSVPSHKLTFMPEMSVGKEDDILSLPNVALLCIANMVSKSNNILTSMGLNALLTHIDSPPIIQQTAKEFMFTYNSPLVSIGNKLAPFWIYFHELGIVDRIYDFNGDVSTIYTGDTDLRLSGVFATYNHLPYLPEWPSAPCNKLSGSSDGMKFPSMIKPNETLWFYRKSIGRALPLIQVGASTACWIPIVSYKFKDDIFDYNHGHEENRCFCQNNQCPRNGLLDVSMWYYGFPIAISFPHFYKADSSIHEEIEGIKPQAHLHESYFHINPQIGISINVSAKLQANLALGDISSIFNCQRFSDLVIPLLWIDINVPKLTFFYEAILFVATRMIPITETITSCLLIIGGFWLIAGNIVTLVTSDWKDEMKNRKVTSPKRNKYNSAVRKLSQSIMLANTKSNEYIFPLMTSSSNTSDEEEAAMIPLTMATDSC